MVCKLYKHFDIRPAFLLSECSFVNLQNCGMEIGSDVCLHTEDNITCENCELHKLKDPYYPIVNSDLYLDLLIDIGKVPEDKNNIEDFIMENATDKTKQIIQEYVYEYKGW